MGSLLQGKDSSGIYRHPLPLQSFDTTQLQPNILTEPFYASGCLLTMYRHPTHLLTALCCILLSHCIPVASQSQYTLNRNTRLASWSTWISPSNGKKHEASCRGPDPKFKDYVYSPHVYFQDAGGGVREVLFQNGVWNNGNDGRIIVKAATNSPLAVTQWWEGDNVVVGSS